MKGPSRVKKHVLPFLVSIVGLSATLLLCFGFSDTLLFKAICCFIVSVSLFILTAMQYRQKKSLQRHEDYVNSMVHELKTPIASIQLLGEMLSDKTLTLSDKDRMNNINLIVSQTSRLKSMLESILKGVRLENGRMMVNKGRIEINKVIERTSKRLLPIANQAGCKLEIVSEATNTCLETDESLLESILVNLVENAIKYGGKGCTIYIGTKRFSKHYEVYVSDTGKGIEARDLKRIFRKYYRANQNSAFTQPNGYGLGLYYVKNATKALGVKIKVESKVGKGTTFTLCFPNKSII